MQLGRPRHGWGIFLKWGFKKHGVEGVNGTNWLRVRTNGGHLLKLWIQLKEKLKRVTYYSAFHLLL
jgi:hypothetical protein